MISDTKKSREPNIKGSGFNSKILLEGCLKTQSHFLTKMIHKIIISIFNFGTREIHSFPIDLPLKGEEKTWVSYLANKISHWSLEAIEINFYLH